MANVKFYRGPEAHLPSTNLEEGAFYLTTDTWRLYNVINEGTQATPDLQMRPLGEKINIIQNTASIGNAAEHIGEFAYVESGNIFAVSIPNTPSGAKWVQINQQGENTQLQSLTFSATAANDTATVSLQAHNANNTEPTGTFKVAAGTGIDVSASGDTVTIAKEATPVTVTGTTDGTVTIDGTAVQLKGGDNVTLSTNASTKVITINGEPGGVDSVAVAPVTSPNPGFTVSVTGNDNVTKSGSVDPTIQLGDHDDELVHFVGGTAILDVYTKDEIDSSLTGLNAMVYRGTLGTGGSTTTVPTTGVQVGDTYKVVSNVTVPIDGNDTNTAHAGDLVIARGTETDGYITSGLVWDIVRGADDVDTNYTLKPITNGSKLVINGDNSETSQGSLVIAGDNTYISANSVANGNTNTVTLSHATHTTNTTTGTKVEQQSGDPATYTGITGVTVDGAGHVTALQTTELEVVDTRIKANGVDATTTVGASSGTITVTQGVKITENTDREISDTSAFTMTSAGSTINMSVSGTNVNYDIVWGTF